MDLIRDYLLVHRSLDEVVNRFRDGELRFEHVRSVVGDSDDSPLFRIKERCHLLFRDLGVEGTPDTSRQALFDLAIGSLFHEALKLRENLYEVEIYGPRIRALRASACESGDGLLTEFEKLLAVAEGRLQEAVEETAALITHTRTQLGVLLAELRDEPLIARTLYASRSELEAVFPDGLDAVLRGLYGDALTGYVVVARSYLESAYFDEAIVALAEAGKRSAEARPDLRRLASYAEGMQAFLAGDYDRSLSRLADWVEAGPRREEARFAQLAISALSHLGQLVEAPERVGSVRAARDLISRIEPHCQT